MRPGRRLALRRESLTELTADELARAGGGYAPPTFQHADCSLDDVLLDVTLHKDCSWSCPL